VLGGTNSLHTNALDETLALPTAESAEIALRTQAVLMEETGVVNVADPLGGSWYVEALTDKLEAEAEEIFARITELGGGDTREHAIGPMTSGILRGIEDGWFTGAIADAAFTYQRKLEKGDKRIVGVNTHTTTVSRDLDILRVSHEVELDQRKLLADRRSTRDQSTVDRALKDLVAAARTTDNMIPPMLAAARAEATLGEICGVLRDEWGAYTEQARF
jgi:methylmalonyl-CoA mutase N-terminal domain/subunit